MPRRLASCFIASIKARPTPWRWIQINRILSGHRPKDPIRYAPSDGFVGGVVFRRQGGAYVSDRTDARRIGFQSVVDGEDILTRPALDGSVACLQGAQPVSDHLALAGILARGWVGARRFL